MIELKIGKNNYKISEQDKFLYNGHCTQLMTQSKEKVHFGQRALPILSQENIKQIEQYEKVGLPHTYFKGCRFFSLKLNEVK